MQTEISVRAESETMRLSKGEIKIRKSKSGRVDKH